MIPSILVVEEHPALRDGYERALRDEGYEVLTVSSSRDLVDLVRKTCADCVVIDPDSDGGDGMRAALKVLEAGLPASLVFNTSRPYSMETDFSTWVADSYAVRSQGVGDLLRAVQQVLPKVAANS